MEKKLPRSVGSVAQLLELLLFISLCHGQRLLQPLELLAACLYLCESSDTPEGRVELLILSIALNENALFYPYSKRQFIFMLKIIFPQHFEGIILLAYGFHCCLRILRSNFHPLQLFCLLPLAMLKNFSYSLVFCSFARYVYSQISKNLFS